MQPTSQITVQAIHAAIEATRSFISDKDQHPHLVLCAIKSEADLFRAADYLEQSGIPFESFREPDLNHQLTSLATQPLSEYDPIRKKMDRFQLLTFDKE